MHALVPEHIQFLWPQEVSSLAGLLPELEGSTEGCFVCLSWLDGWVNNEGQPDPVDNSVLLCEEHRKLNPLLPPGTYKYISSTAWEQLTVRGRVFFGVSPGGGQLKKFQTPSQES
jgi:hypothetical protein